MPETAIDRVRRFAGQSGELVQFDPALLDAPAPLDPDFLPEGIADFGDVEGHHPDLPIKTSLKELDGERVVLTRVTFTPTPPQFLAEKRAKGLDASELTAVVTLYRPADDRYYLAVAGNSRVMREAERLHAMLARVEGVRARVESYQSTGGTGYHFGPWGDAHA